MENRCECYRAMGDATGEKAIVCNAPGEYCPTCGMTVCVECHPDIATSDCVTAAKKSPARAGNTLKQPAKRWQA